MRKTWEALRVRNKKRRNVVFGKRARLAGGLSFFDSGDGVFSRRRSLEARRTWKSPASFGIQRRVTRWEGDDVQRM